MELNQIIIQKRPLKPRTEICVTAVVSYPHMIREVMRVVQKQLKTTLFIERYGIVDTEIERIAVLSNISISLYLRFIIDIVAGKEHIPPVEHTKII